MKAVCKGLYRQSFNSATVGLIPILALSDEMPKWIAKQMRKARDKGHIAGAQHLIGDHRECPKWHNDRWPVEPQLTGVAINLSCMKDALKMVADDKDMPDEFTDIKYDMQRASAALEDAISAVHAGVIRFHPEHQRDEWAKNTIKRADTQNHTLKLVGDVVSTDEEGKLRTPEK